MTKSRPKELDFLGIQTRRNTSGDHPSYPSPSSLLGSSQAATQPSPTGNPLLTIVFNGNVSVYDVPAERAMEVIRLAASLDSPSSAGRVATSTSVLSPPSLPDGIGRIQLNQDLPISMRRPLRSFLEKRKTR